MADVSVRQAIVDIERLGVDASKATAADVRETVEFGLTLITLRTKSGLDADRRPFQRYSPRYTVERRRAGLSTRPDLVRIGHMVGSLIPIVSGTPPEGRITFGSPREAAKGIAHTEGTGRLPRRDWFDIRAAADLDAVTEVFADAIMERLGR